MFTEINIITEFESEVGLDLDGIRIVVMSGVVVDQGSLDNNRIVKGWFILLAFYATCDKPSMIWVLLGLGDRSALCMCDHQLLYQ